MKKYLVDVYLPTIDMHMNAFIPNTKEIGEVTGLLARAAESLSGSSYLATCDTLLFCADDGVAYERSITVEEAGIRNASRLMLI